MQILRFVLFKKFEKLKKILRVFSSCMAYYLFARIYVRIATRYKKTTTSISIMS